MRLVVALAFVNALTAAPLVAASPSERIRTLVLDVQSGDLPPSEVETLTSLITARLARYPQLDVMSGADIRRLVDLEAQKQSVGCDDSGCLAELAGALGANLVIHGHVGKLGGTLVVTLNAYDAGKSSAVARQTLQVGHVGELPGRVPAAVDALVRPLIGAIEGGAVAPVDGVDLATLSARAQEVFEERAMRVCTDDRDKAIWWFCDAKEPVTENAFVRRYVEVTGQRDLDRALVDRVADNHVVSLASMGIGAGVLALGAGMAGGNLATGGALDPFVSPLSGGLDATVSGLGFAGLGLLGIGVGAVLFFTEIRHEDGRPRDHTLTEADGRAAVARYNTALADALRKQFGAAEVP